MGIWLSNQRSAKAKNSLSADREKKLNETGMVWSKFDHLWERNFRVAERYCSEHGNLNIPADYKAENGTALGQ